MSNLKVLNLYAGIGGNRKRWDDVEVTAVELRPEIAEIYEDHFPRDEVIVDDAHKFLEKNYDGGWDFIWSSPPCPTHSKIRNIAGIGTGQYDAVFPDMKLYQEIIFLERIRKSKGTNFVGGYCVENVRSYYDPLIEPQVIGQHYLWSNFHIPKIEQGGEQHNGGVGKLKERKGFDVNKKGVNTEKVLRNCVNPKLGKHVLNQVKVDSDPINEQQELI